MTREPEPTLVPLEPDDLRVLRWIGEQARPCACEPPAGFQFWHMAGCRRKLLYAGLVTLDCPPRGECLYLLTAAGEKVLADLAAPEQRQAKSEQKKRLKQR